MNILICDDQKQDAGKLAAILRNLGYDSVVFHCGEETLEYIRTGAKVDVCILDIVMPNMNGISLAQSLRNSGYSGEIVFLSTSNDFACESYSVNAYNYLIKPPSPAQVEQVLDGILKRREAADSSGITIHTKKYARFVRFQDILFLEVINHMLYFHLADQSVLELRTPLSEIAPQLTCDKRFTQCGQSYVLNKRYVSAIKGNLITMSDGTNIPIPRRLLTLREEIIQWMLGDNEP